MFLKKESGHVTLRKRKKNEVTPGFLIMAQARGHILPSQACLILYFFFYYVLFYNIFKINSLKLYYNKYLIMSMFLNNNSNFYGNINNCFLNNYI